jgi:hypothetical protein
VHRRRHPPQRPWYQQSALLTPTPTPSQSVRPVAANSTSGPVRRPRSSARLTAVLANVTEDRPARRGPGREGGRTTRREAERRRGGGHPSRPADRSGGAGTGEGRWHRPRAEVGRDADTCSDPRPWVHGRPHPRRRIRHPSAAICRRHGTPAHP